MLIQLRDFPDGEAARLKLITQQRTASKAVERALSDYVQLRIRNRELKERIQALEEQIKVRDQVIERARESAAALLDHVAQTDMLAR